MNPYDEQYPNDDRWEPVTRVVFYEPRTIPAGWDLSEYLPAYASFPSQFSAKEE
jgi:hypothetical protein